MSSKRFQSSAFTLIELLIVVAIIAILAAIAVPNFLEAQMRAKVSSAWADMRTITVGLESYRVDNNRYPVTEETPGVYPDSPFNQIGGGFFSYAGRLTTPVAFLSSVPKDQFTRIDRGAVVGQGWDYYEYWSSTPQRNFPNGGLPTKPGVFWDLFADSTAYVIWSYGPNRTPGPTGAFGAPWLAFDVNNVYDPSNGTVSNGNLYFAGPGSQIPGGK
jgi:type II secretion system protein G